MPSLLDQHNRSTATSPPPPPLRYKSNRSNSTTEDQNEPNRSIMQQETSDKEEEETIESLLSVPISFILCGGVSKNKSTKNKLGQQRGKNGSGSRRMLRSEAMTLINIRLLSVELDSLMSIIFNTLLKLRSCRDSVDRVLGLQNKLQFDRNQNPPKKEVENDENTRDFLSRPIYSCDSTLALQTRALLPLLYVHGERTCLPSLKKMTSEIERVLSELHSCGVALRQCSEQNLCISQQLTDMFSIEMDFDEDITNAIRQKSKGGALAREKKLIGDVENEVCTRIENLLEMGFEHNSGSLSNHVQINDEKEQSPFKTPFQMARCCQTGRYMSMESFCNDLMAPQLTLEGGQVLKEEQMPVDTLSKEIGKRGRNQGETIQNTMEENRKRRRDSDNPNQKASGMISVDGSDKVSKCLLESKFNDKDDGKGCSHVSASPISDSQIIAASTLTNFTQNSKSINQRTYGC